MNAAQIQADSVDVLGALGNHYNLTISILFREMGSVDKEMS